MARAKKTAKKKAAKKTSKKRTKVGSKKTAKKRTKKRTKKVAKKVAKTGTAVAKKKATKKRKKKRARKKVAKKVAKTGTAVAKKSKKKGRKKKRKTPLPVSARKGRVSKQSKAACAVGSASRGRPTRSKIKKACGPDAPSFPEASDQFSAMGVRARQGNPEADRLRELANNPDRQRRLASRLSNP